MWFEWLSLDMDGATVCPPKKRAASCISSAGLLVLSGVTDRQLIRSHYSKPPETYAMLQFVFPRITIQIAAA